MNIGLFEIERRYNNRKSVKYTGFKEQTRFIFFLKPVENVLFFLTDNILENGSLRSLLWKEPIAHPICDRNERIYCLPKPKPFRFDLELEILVRIMEMLDNYTLCNICLLNKLSCRLASQILLKRALRRKLSLECDFRISHERYLRAKGEKSGYLSHYKSFLSNISQREITGCIWYTRPPLELQTVCECLCLLGGISKNIKIPCEYTQIKKNEGLHYSWQFLRKFMSQDSFIYWFHNLEKEVDYISIDAVRRAERIIMIDPTIVYDQLREVSMVGYRLLIIVAACIQYCTISEQLKVRLRECAYTKDFLDTIKEFIEILKSRLSEDQF